MTNPLGIKTCQHYGVDGPAFWPLRYQDDQGRTVIRCATCGRKIIDANSQEAIRRWNAEVEQAF